MDHPLGGPPYAFEGSIKDASCTVCSFSLYMYCQYTCIFMCGHVVEFLFGKKVHAHVFMLYDQFDVNQYWVQFCCVQDFAQLSFFSQPDGCIMGNGTFKSSVLLPGYVLYHFDCD